MTRHEQGLLIVEMALRAEGEHLVRGRCLAQAAVGAVAAIDHVTGTVR